MKKNYIKELLTIVFLLYFGGQYLKNIIVDKYEEIWSLTYITCITQ